MDLCQVDFSELSDIPTTLKRTFFKEESLYLCCEWDNCEKEFTEYGEFEMHMDTHVKVVVLFHQTEGVLIGCLWADCGFEAMTLDYMKRHMHQHVFCTKLMAHGSNMLGGSFQKQSKTWDNDTPSSSTLEYC